MASGEHSASSMRVALSARRSAMVSTKIALKLKSGAECQQFLWDCRQASTRRLPSTDHDLRRGRQDDAQLAAASGDKSRSTSSLRRRQFKRHAAVCTRFFHLMVSDYHRHLQIYAGNLAALMIESARTLIARPHRLSGEFVYVSGVWASATLLVDNCRSWIRPNVVDSMRSVVSATHMHWST